MKILKYICFFLFCCMCAVDVSAQECRVEFYIGDDISGQKPALCQDDIETAIPEGTETGSGSREYSVLVVFKESKKQALKDVTSNNIGKRMAIVCNGSIISAPVIASVCDVGEVQITGLGTYEEAEHLASILQPNETIMGYEEILAEYKMLAENNFDESLRGQIRYANEGVWNFNGQGKYSVYYRLADLAEDGEPELLISVNEKEAPFNILDIYGKSEGKATTVIESNEAVGNQSAYYVTNDGRIKNRESEGEWDTKVSYYRLLADSVTMELEDQYIYDGWADVPYMHIDSTGYSESVSKDEYRYVSSDQDVDFTSEWTLLHEGHFIHYAE